MQLVISRPGKADKTFSPEPGVYTIGSHEDNALVLYGDDIAWRHAVLGIGAGGDAWIEDLHSPGGTWLEGARVAGRLAVQPGQEIRIGTYAIRVGEKPAAAPAPAAVPAAVPAPAAPPPPAAAQPPTRPPADESEPAAGGGDAVERAKRDIKKQVHEELLRRLDIKRLTSNRIGEKDLRDRARGTVQHIIHDVRARLPPGIEAAALAKELYDEAVGLGPLEDLLEDPEITEIMVNGPESVYVERRGKLHLTRRSFMSEDSVLAIIERIVSPIGRRIDESQPYVDARLPDGSRVNAVIPPLSLTGPCLTIRKFSREPFTAGDLVRFGTLHPTFAEFLQASVALRKNIVVSGGTGSGKTTLLNVLSSFLPPDERIITIEDAAELRLAQRHVIRLEARPPNIEGRGAITIRDLVRNALRMRPDRIVVGECRGGEALDMLQAMNTGHDGSLTTVHANSPRDVISRLETMVLMSGMDLPLRAISEQIASAVQLVVHIGRFSDGSRKVSRITEIVGLEGGQITMQDIFVFDQTGLGSQGEVLGAFRATGAVPTFVEEMAAKGVTINRRMFDPLTWTS